MEQKTGLKKIVVVACPVGRAGSSAVMGVLNLAGLCPGNDRRIVKGGGMNPKGFFELHAQDKLLKRIFRGYYPGPTIPPDLDIYNENWNAKLRKFNKLLQREFKGESQIAIKAPRWLTLPYYHHLSRDFDVRVISLTRDLEKQVTSTCRVWQQTYDPILVGASKDQIRCWLLSWQEFVDIMRSQYDAKLPIYDLSFDQLMAHPIDQTNMLIDWLGMPSLDDNILASWFDASLVNRKTLPSISRFEAKKRGLKRRLVNIVRKPFMHYSPCIVE